MFEHVEHDHTRAGAALQRQSIHVRPDEPGPRLVRAAAGAACVQVYADAMESVAREELKRESGPTPQVGNYAIIFGAIPGQHALNQDAAPDKPEMTFLDLCQTEVSAMAESCRDSFRECFRRFSHASPAIRLHPGGIPGTVARYIQFRSRYEPNQDRQASKGFWILGLTALHIDGSLLG
jgi:hypothetical protein